MSAAEQEWQRLRVHNYTVIGIRAVRRSLKRLGWDRVCAASNGQVVEVEDLKGAADAIYLIGSAAVVRMRDELHTAEVWTRVEAARRRSICRGKIDSL